MGNEKLVADYEALFEEGSDVVRNSPLYEFIQVFGKLLTIPDAALPESPEADQGDESPSFDKEIELGDGEVLLPGGLTPKGAQSQGEQLRETKRRLVSPVAPPLPNS